MGSASVLSFSPGILQRSRSGAAILMAGIMDKLHKEAQRDNQQANGDDYEGGRDRGSARPVEAWCFWLIGHRLDLFQVAQIMEELAHRLVTLIPVTTNGLHHYGSQCRRKLRIREEDRGRILRDMLVHNSKDILSLERRMTTEHFIQHHTGSINIGASHTALALELFRGHIIGRANCFG